MIRTKDTIFKNKIYFIFGGMLILLTTTLVISINILRNNSIRQAKNVEMSAKVENKSKVIQDVNKEGKATETNNADKVGDKSNQNDEAQAKVNVIEDNRVGGEGNQQTIKTNNSSAPQQQAQPTQQAQSQQEQKPTQQGIQTQYGDHTYGVRNQDEYNKVMNKVRVAASTVDSQQVDQFTMAYLNGDRPDNYPEDSEQYHGLNSARSTIGYMEMKCGKDATLKWYKTKMAANKLARSANAKNPYDGTPSSAYDVLYGGLVDCDANSQVKSAVYDASGFETSVRYANGHAWEVVKVGDIWWDNEGVPSGLNGNALSNPN